MPRILPAIHLPLLKNKLKNTGGGTLAFLQQFSASEVMLVILVEVNGKSIMFPSTILDIMYLYASLIPYN